MPDAILKPPGNTPGGQTVRINAATALLVERLQAHHLAIFGSKPSRPSVIQRAVEALFLQSRPAADTPALP